MTEHITAEMMHWWDTWGDLVIMAIGLIVFVLVIAALVQFKRATDKSSAISRVATIVVMVWTSEGLIEAAWVEWHMPIGFIAASFFVFESLQLAAWYKAEEERKRVGHPGAAGRYTFLIGLVQGIIAATAAEDGSLAFMRIALPLLALGLMWILMVSDRESDSPEVKKLRAERRTRVAATWAITPKTLLIRRGWMNAGPGDTTTALEQRAAVDKMVRAADEIAIGTTGLAKGARESRRTRRARMRLRRLMRTATPEMIEQVRVRALQSAAAEQLVVAAPADVEAITSYREARRTAIQVSATRTDPVGEQTDLVADQVATRSPLTGDQVGPWSPPVGDPVRPVNGHAADPTFGGLLGLPGTTATATATGDPVGDLVDPGPSEDVRPIPDDVVIQRHREQLDTLIAEGKLSRNRIESTCKVNRRQAERILASLMVDQHWDALIAAAASAGMITTAAIKEITGLADGPAIYALNRFNTMRDSAN